MNLFFNEGFNELKNLAFGRPRVPLLKSPIVQWGAVFAAAMLALVNCHKLEPTFTTDNTDCPSGYGGFIPGEEAEKCQLFFYGGAPAQIVEITEYKKLHCNNSPKIGFVQCVDSEGTPVMPESTHGPWCPFLGDQPTCPNFDASSLYIQVDERE